MIGSLGWQLIWIAGLGIGAASMAWLFRRAGLPGSGALAGLIIGLLLGPGIAGRLAPDWYESNLVGGVQARRDFEQKQAAADGALIAAGQLNATITIDEYSRLATASQSAHAEWVRAREQHQATTRWFTIGLASLFALLGARLHRTPRMSMRWSISAVSIGLWSSLVSGGLTAVALVWIGYALVPSLAAGAIVGAGALFLDPQDVRTARDVERGGAAMMLTAARIATLVAGGALTITLVRTAGLQAVTPALVIVASLIGAVMPPLASRSLRRGVMLILFPWVMALAASRMEIFSHFALGTSIVLVVLSGDGRWFTALLGAWSLGGRRSLHAMRLVIPVMSAGPMQAALVAAALHTGAVPEFIGFGLLFGVCYLESSAPFRRAMAKGMVRMEDEIASDGHDV